MLQYLLPDVLKQVFVVHRGIPHATIHTPIASVKGEVFCFFALGIGYLNLVVIHLYHIGLVGLVLVEGSDPYHDLNIVCHIIMDWTSLSECGRTWMIGWTQHSLLLLFNLLVDFILSIH